MKTNTTNNIKKQSGVHIFFDERYFPLHTVPISPFHPFFTVFSLFYFYYYYYSKSTMRSFQKSVPLFAGRVRHAATKQKPSWKPRSRAEFMGMVAGASLFPIAVGLMTWWDNKKAEANPPQLAPDFVSTKEVKMTAKQLLGGPFEMTESRTGKRITDKELFEDRWTLLYFGFSKCAEICPNTLKYLVEVLHACDKEYGNDPDVAEEQKKLQIVFASVDFIRDKPDVVETFVSKFEPRVRGLCGSRADVERAAGAWRVYYSSVDETEEEKEAREAKGVEAPKMDDTFQFDHSSAVYIVGPDGQMKDFFFKEMGLTDTVNRIGVHYQNVYGFSDTRKA
ncbi:cytochrome c oxidase assembly factor-like protein [Angomonas deanei]|nr:cytochrome c oxidase assembly factor-like protein [Angomonas deanei]|eukprot:EPY42278.1 cytochrome c oxidase assembly factor-like protein [Angomonas deanei]